MLSTQNSKGWIFKYAIYLNLNAFKDAVGNHSHLPAFTGTAQNLPDIQEKYSPTQ